MWWRLEAAARNNRKVRSVNDSAKWLWACCGMYAAEQLTDSFVPDEEVAKMAAERDNPNALDECLRVGLLERVAGGIVVHDYHDYNPFAEEVKKLSRARSRAGRKGAMSKHKSPGKCHEQVPVASACGKSPVGGWVGGSGPKGGSGGPPAAPASVEPDHGPQATRIARIAKWHAEAMRATRGSRAVVEDIPGAVVCEPVLAALSDADCEAVVRAYVADDDPWLADKRRRWALRWLDASRANRYLTPASATAEPAPRMLRCHDDD